VYDSEDGGIPTDIASILLLFYQQISVPVLNLKTNWHNIYGDAAIF